MGGQQAFLRTGHKEGSKRNSAFKLYSNLHIQQENNINFVGICWQKVLCLFQET
jgi:hypothetical protein